MFYILKVFTDKFLEQKLTLTVTSMNKTGKILEDQGTTA